MPLGMKTYKTISEYINSFNGEGKDKLLQVQKLLNDLIPNGEEAIKYGIPTIRVNNKNVVHFAAYDTHFAFYPASNAIEVFSKELKTYSTSKGTIRFALDKPLPVELITKIVKHRLQNL